MIVVVFRTRMQAEVGTEYAELARHTSELVKDVPGYITHKLYVAEDGERVTIVEFQSEEALEIWRTNSQHMAAKRRGFSEFYSEFRFQICQVLKSKSWSSPHPRTPSERA